MAAASAKEHVRLQIGGGAAAAALGPQWSMSEQRFSFARREMRRALGAP